MDVKRARGFTLIELLMVVVVVAVLASIALPNLRDVIVRTRLKTAASDLHTSLVFARSEAIKRNCEMNVVANTADWSQGWSVKTTTKITPTPGACPIPPNPPAGTVLTRQDAYPSSFALTTTDTANAPLTVPSVTFSGTGRKTGSDVIFVISSVQYPAIQARCVRVDPSGRAAVRVDKNGNSADGCN